MKPENEDVKISLVIPREMYYWLDNHREINRSKLFRDAVNTVRNPLYRQLSDTLVLNMTTMISIILGFLLIFLIQYIAFFYILVTWVTLSSIIIGLAMLTLIRKSRRYKNGHK